MLGAIRPEKLPPKTKDRYERSFQSCHLGYFLLTARLYEEGLLNNSNLTPTYTNTNDTNYNIDGNGNGNGNGCPSINVSSVLHRSARVNSRTKTTMEVDDADNTDVNTIEYGFDFEN